MSVIALRERARQGVALQWRQPLYRSALLLGMNSLLSAVMGVAFWLVAARLYAPVPVGLSSTAVSVMTLLAGLAQLNLMSFLLRFVPQAEDPTRLIGAACSAAVLLAAVVGGGFVATLGYWSRGLRDFLPGLAMRAVFVLAVCGWTLLVMLGAALVALGRADTTTLGTQAFNALKLVLLVALASVLPAAGVFDAWAAAAAAVSVVALVYVFRRAAPAFRRTRVVAVKRHSARDVARYVGPDYVASLAWIGAGSVAPVLVLNLTDAAHAAVFGLTWQMCLVMYGLPIAFGQALVAHGTREPGRLDQHHRHVLRLSLTALVPAVAVILLFAPQLLSVFGPWYAGQGAGAARLLALSTLPGAVFALEVSRARVARQMRLVMVANLALVVLVLGLTAVLVPRLGITGAGWAWLTAQSVVAAGIAAHRRLRAITWGPRGAGRARGRALRAVAPMGWLPERTLRGVSDTTAVLMRAPSGDAVLKLATTTPGRRSIEREGAVLEALGTRPGLRDWSRRLVPETLDTGAVAGTRFVLQRRLPGVEPGPCDGLDARVLAAIAPLHQDTATRGPVFGETLSRWVDEPAGVVRAALPRAGRDVRRGLAVLVEELHRGLSGRTLTVAWTHGDLFPGNVLVAPDGEVTGLVDWANADLWGPPVLDAAFWLLCVSAQEGRRQLGREVVRRLREPVPWTDAETRLLRTTPGGAEMDGRLVLLLAWLTHVHGNLTKSARYAHSRVWLGRNVSPVLRELAPGRPPAGKAADPAPTVAVRSRGVVRAVRGEALSLVPGLVAAIVWLTTLSGVRLGAMNDLGLVSVLHPGYWVALGLVLVTLVGLIYRDRSPGWVLVGYVVILIAILHATPALLYDAPRYSWTWKHVGVVDYIIRHHDVNPAEADAFSVYQGWPGFFALNAAVVKGAGLTSALSYAAWAPPVVELALLAPLRLLYGTLTRRRSQIWLGIVLFYLGNWVGQDYFAPQALTYVMALFVLALALRYLHPNDRRRPLSRWRRRVAGEVVHEASVSTRQRLAVIGVLVLLFVGIVSTHQLTPLMLILWLVVLAVGGNISRAWLPVLLTWMFVMWAVLMGRTFLDANLHWIITSIGRPSDNAQTFVDLSHATAGQITVSFAARGLSAGMGLLAMLGWLRMPKGSPRRLPLLLAAAPCAMLVANSYGGEMLFRVFLFALPFFALMAAALLLPRPSTDNAVARGLRRNRLLAPVLATALVLGIAGTFTLAYYGKERMNYFSPQEVAASRWLYRHAPAGSIMVSPNAAYPWAFVHYDSYRYVWLEGLPAAQRRSLGRDPVAQVEAAARPRTGPTYVVLMRTESAAARYTGTLRYGAVASLDAALRRDGHFRLVFANPDAAIFQLPAQPLAGVR